MSKQLKTGALPRIKIKKVDNGKVFFTAQHPIEKLRTVLI